MKRLSLPAGYFRDERHYSFKVTTSGRRLPNFKRLSLPARVSYATLLFGLQDCKAWAYKSPLPV